MGGVKIQTTLGQGRGCRREGTGQSGLSPSTAPLISLSSSTNTHIHTHTPQPPQASSTPPPSPSIPPVARAPDGNPPQCSSSFHVLISSPAPRLHVAPTSLGPAASATTPSHLCLTHPPTLNPPPSSTTTTTKGVAGGVHPTHPGERKTEGGGKRAGGG